MTEDERLLNETMQASWFEQLMDWLDAQLEEMRQERRIYDEPSHVLPSPTC